MRKTIAPSAQTPRTAGALKCKKAALKPCPFCSGKADQHEIEDEDDANFGGHFICCGNLACGASTNLRFANKEDPRPLLAEQWNLRSPNACDDLVAALEAARVYVEHAHADCPDDESADAIHRDLMRINAALSKEGR